MFGDLGLLLRKPRAATIVCREDTEFATLTADDYRKILKNAEIMKMNHQVDFF
jgi:CRP-like cAMP-binding protein